MSSHSASLKVVSGDLVRNESVRKINISHWIFSLILILWNLISQDGIPENERCVWCAPRNGSASKWSSTARLVVIGASDTFHTGRCVLFPGDVISRWRGFVIGLADVAQWLWIYFVWGWHFCDIESATIWYKCYDSFSSISRGFLRSNWCRTNFLTFFHKIKTLIDCLFATKK